MVSKRGNILRITGLLRGFDVFCVVRLKQKLENSRSADYFGHHETRVTSRVKYTLRQK